MGILTGLNFTHVDNSTSAPFLCGSTSEKCQKTDQLMIDPYMPDVRRLFSSNQICYTNAVLVVIFGTLGLSLVVCCLIARRRRLATLIIGSILLLTYFAIGFGFSDPHWTEGRASGPVTSSLSFFNRHTHVRANLSVKIGLSFFNVSYATHLHHWPKRGVKGSILIEFEERFEFANDPWTNDYLLISDAKHLALNRGLPSPVIAIAEYLGSDGHSFRWGPMFTKAGEGAKITLEFALAAVVLSTIMILVVPKYGLILFPFSGALMSSSSIIYWSYSPRTSEQLYVEGIPIPLYFGRTIFLVFFVGALNMFLGIVSILLLHFKVVRNVSTLFELNYDTSWSDQVILDDMKERHLDSITGTTVFERSMLKLRTTFRKKKTDVDSPPPAYTVENGFLTPAVRPKFGESLGESDGPSSTLRRTFNSSVRGCVIVDQSENSQTNLLKGRSASFRGERRQRSRDPVRLLVASSKRFRSLSCQQTRTPRKLGEIKKLYVD